jgi:hypothetical protein
MNLLSLLTKGRAFKGLNDTKAAYKLPSGSVLPNFGGRRDFSTMPNPGREGSQRVLFEHPPRPEEPPAAAKADDMAPMPASVVASAPARSIWRRSADGCWKVLRRWTGMGNGFSAHGPTVQAELALEKVRVVRNDLSEDDVEVVTVEKKSENGPAQKRDLEYDKVTTNR